VVPLTDDRIVAVTMPKWGLSMQLGKITAWAVAEGDEVQVGDDLADIETEKITGTLEAADAGTCAASSPRSVRTCRSAARSR
jgi:Pyruvate/2-oxoglutarate dehydrogenase complex, dihydrolipoamide acyltransferase (E2) component, and related enzymes